MHTKVSKLLIHTTWEFKNMLCERCQIYMKSRTDKLIYGNRNEKGTKGGRQGQGTDHKEAEGLGGRQQHLYWGCVTQLYTFSKTHSATQFRVAHFIVSNYIPQ